MEHAKLAADSSSECHGRADLFRPWRQWCQKHSPAWLQPFDIVKKHTAAREEANQQHAKVALDELLDIFLSDADAGLQAAETKAKAAIVVLREVDAAQLLQVVELVGFKALSVVLACVFKAVCKWAGVRSGSLVIILYCIVLNVRHPFAEALQQQAPPIRSAGGQVRRRHWHN